MNYIPYASWGLSPGDTDKARANFFASWGLMEDAPDGTPIVHSSGGIVLKLKHLWDIFYHTTKRLWDMF